MKSAWAGYAVMLAAALLLAYSSHAAVQGVLIQAVLHEYPSNDTVEMTVNATFEAGVAALVVESYKSHATGIEMSNIGLVINQSRLLTFVDDVNQAVVAKILGEPGQGVQGYAAWNAKLEDQDGEIHISVDYRFEPASTVPVTVRGELTLLLDPAVPVPYKIHHEKTTIIQYGNETEERHSRITADITVEGIQGPAAYRVIDGVRAALLVSVLQGGSITVDISGEQLEAENTGDTVGYILLVYKSGYAVSDQVPFYTLRILEPGEKAEVKLPGGHGLPEETVTIGQTGPGNIILLALLALGILLAAAWRLKR